MVVCSIMKIIHSFLFFKKEQKNGEEFVEMEVDGTGLEKISVGLNEEDEKRKKNI